MIYVVIWSQNAGKDSCVVIIFVVVCGVPGLRSEE